MSSPELDIKTLQSLPSQQQDIYLLNFVSILTNYVYQLSPDDCSSQQTNVQKEIFQILNLPSHFLSRVIRNNIGNCFAHILGKGDRKILFESINYLNSIIGNGKNKSEGDLRVKHAAIHCVGDIFASAGDSAIGLHPLVCASLLKVLKYSNNNAGLRAAIFQAFSKIVGKICSSFDEAIARDLWKQARSFASNDKAALVQICACKALKKLSEKTDFFENLHDFENLKSTILKVIDSPSPHVRLAAASCLAQALVKSHTEVPINNNDAPKSKKIKWSNNKKQKEPIDDEEIQRPEIPSQKKTQKLVFTLTEILKHLASFYVKSTTSNNARAGIAICYTRIFQKLARRNVEGMYMKAVVHLTNDILGHANIFNHRYRLLSTRIFIKVILEDVIGSSILGEAGQINAATFLINDVLKNYPQTNKEQTEPSKHTLVTALSALASLINNLGIAASSFADSCRDCLLQVLQHPSYTVQVYTSFCLRIFTLACPQQLIPCLRICLNNLNRELNLIGTGRNPLQRCISYASGLSAVISASSLQPLYGSMDTNSHILSLATRLLKSSSKAEIRISSAQIQVAWMLIGGLMCLGPNFVKIHLPQLLLLWKNALPKPMVKDNISQLSYFESCFLTHVRECALGSILAFLQFNGRLLTIDVSKRITSMLQNTTSFLKSLPPKKFNDDIAQRLIPSLQLYNLEQMTYRRALQCYIKLVNLSPGGKETLLQSNILTLAVSLFADPEDYSPSSLSTSIANSAGNFETIWNVGDNYGYGVTGLVRGFKIRKLDGESENDELEDDWMEEVGIDADISNVLVSPICKSLEHDSLSIFLKELNHYDEIPDPPATELVNVAIELFAIVFPLTPSKIQESILEQLITFSSTSSLQRDPGRKAAINVNIATSLFFTLKVAGKETSSGDVTKLAVEKILQDLLHQFVIHPDQFLRKIGYEGLALLCKSSGSSFTNVEIKYLVDTIVSNREPSARAGCAKALGSIHSHVGNMATGYYLKTIIGILMSLCNDPYPTVHFWALNSLSRVAESAGYNFSGYVLNSLGMLGQLYVADTHNEEVSSIATSNLELEQPSSVAISRCINSLVNVLGPDLQDVSKPRELILTLVRQLQNEKNPLIHAGSLRCSEHLSLYAPEYIIFPDYVRLLQTDLNSPHLELRNIAIDGLYNLMKKSSVDVVRAAEPGFEDQLWLALDSAPNHEGIKNIIKNWLAQSCLTETSRWLQRCQTVLYMTRPEASETVITSIKDNTNLDLRDEEAAGFASAIGLSKDDTMAPTTGQEPLRWQVRTFAMGCLSDIFLLVSKSNVESSSSAIMSLQKNVSEVIRMAFSASTSNIVKLRVCGLKIIDAVLKFFGKTPDPDFAEVSLLEQFQAQISSALTPAFDADSSPELASEAVNVCAVFIATGIVTDVERMGRILKTLVTALKNFSTGKEMHTIGELKGLSSNAQIMVKMAVFSAWAELQVASTEQKYLVEVLKPYISILTPLWLSSLREFARLRFEPDISMTLGPPSLSGSLDSIYMAFSRETLLRFYQDSWLKLVGAIASLIEQDCDFVFDALDGKPTDIPNTNGYSSGNDINYRDEPVAFFFVLFGIIFEALTARSGSDTLATKEQTLEILQALKKIFHPSVSGHVIYKEAIFSETIDLLDRLVLTEGLDVQMIIVQIGRGLCLAHPFATKPGQTEEEDLSEDIEQLFELTRIIVLVLAGLLPNLTDNPQSVQQRLTDESISLIVTSLSALVDAAEVFPSIIKTDLHACIIHIFATILGTGSCQKTVVPQSLPILKRFINSISIVQEKSVRDSDNSLIQIRSCLKRFLSIYLHAQKRESEVSLYCIRNSLLAIATLFTSGKNRLSASEPVVKQFLDEVLECLNDSMTAKAAASCVRLLLLQMPKTPADQSISYYLLPRLIRFVTNSKIKDPENTRSLIMHTLTIFVTTLVGEANIVAISIILPALLARANKEGPTVYKETSARLLDLASIDQNAFRSVVSEVNREQKQFMESVIVAGREIQAQQGSQADDLEYNRPAITLRMDFGT